MGVLIPALTMSLAAGLACPAGAAEVLAERPSPVKSLAPQASKLTPQFLTPGLAGALQTEIDLFRRRLLAYPGDAVGHLRARAEGQDDQAQAARLILRLVSENGRVVENNEVLQRAIGAAHASKLRRASNMLHNNSPGLLEQVRTAVQEFPPELEIAPVAEALQAAGKVFDGSAVSKPAALAEEAEPMEKPAASEATGLARSGGIVRINIPAAEGKVFESRGNRVSLKDTQTGEVLREFKTGPVQSLVFDKAGHRLFAVGTGADHGVTAFDAATGEVLRRFEKGNLPIEAFALAESGRAAYVADYRQRVWAWDLETGKSKLAAKLNRRKFAIKLLWDDPRAGFSALARELRGALYLYRDGNYTLARPRSRGRLRVQPLPPLESPAAEAQDAPVPIESKKLAAFLNDAPLDTLPVAFLGMGTLASVASIVCLTYAGHLAAAWGMFWFMLAGALPFGAMLMARNRQRVRALLAKQASAAKNQETQATQRLRAMRERCQTLEKRIEHHKSSPDVEFIRNVGATLIMASVVYLFPRLQEMTAMVITGPAIFLLINFAHKLLIRRWEKELRDLRASLPDVEEAAKPHP